MIPSIRGSTPSAGVRPVCRRSREPILDPGSAPPRSGPKVRRFFIPRISIPIKKGDQPDAARSCARPLLEVLAMSERGTHSKILLMLIRYPGQFAHDTRGVEANGSISQHRDEMQKNTAKAEAGAMSERGVHSKIPLVLVSGGLVGQPSVVPARGVAVFS